jgi:hypothetical protein
MDGLDWPTVAHRTIQLAYLGQTKPVQSPAPPG